MKRQRCGGRKRETSRRAPEDGVTQLFMNLFSSTSTSTSLLLLAFSREMPSEKLVLHANAIKYSLVLLAVALPVPALCETSTRAGRDQGTMSAKKR